MSNFIPPNWRPVDEDGNVMPGAKLYFYETGTVTTQAVYSDKELTTPITQPVTADANGKFSDPIWMQEAAYTVKLDKSDDTNVFSEDDIWGAQSMSAKLGTRVKQVASNPLDYGAVGDGVAEESSYVQSAIDAATSVVDLLGKTYRIGQVLNVPQAGGIIIKNGTLDATADTPNYIFSLTASGSTVLASLTSDATAGDITLAVSTTGLVAGRYIRVSTNSDWVSSDSIFEWVRIKSVDSSVQVTLDRPLRFSYATADSSFVFQPVRIPDIRFENIKFVGASTCLAGIRLVRGLENITIRDCVFSDFDTAGVIVGDYCVNTEISGCTFSDCNGGDGHGVEATGTGTGLDIRDCIFENCIRPIQCGFDTSSHFYDVSITNNRFFGTQTSAIRLGSYCHFANISNNLAEGDASFTFAILSGVSAMVANNRIVRGYIFFSNAITATTVGPYFIHGNHIESASDDAIGGTFAGSNCEKLSIVGNTITDPTGGYGIELSGTGDIDALIITDNTLDAASVDSFGTGDDTIVSRNLLLNTSFLRCGGGANSCTVSDNDISGGYIDAAGGERCIVSGNSINSSEATSSLLEFSAEHSVVRGNTIRGTATTGSASAIAFTGTNMRTLIVDANTIYMASGSSRDAISIPLNSAILGSVSITNNVVDGAASGAYRHGVFVDTDAARTCGPLNISGNNIRNSDDDGIHVSGDYPAIKVDGNIVDRTGQTDNACVNLAGDSVSDIDNFSVNNNILLGGAYGVETTNNLDEAISLGNVILDFATGNYSWATTPITVGANATGNTLTAT